MKIIRHFVEIPTYMIDRASEKDVILAEAERRVKDLLGFKIVELLLKYPNDVYFKSLTIEQTHLVKNDYFDERLRYGIRLEVFFLNDIEGDDEIMEHLKSSMMHISEAMKDYAFKAKLVVKI